VVEARQAAYRERLQRTYEALRARVERDAPDLLPALASASPRPVRLGYQILPRLVADAPRPSERARAQPRSYSWPWTEQMIERDAKKLDQLEAELDGSPPRPASERKAAYEKMVADYRKLAEGARTIDAHIQYNRLWQPAIARDRPSYDRQTVLEQAVLERQTVVDALASSDEAAFRKALAPIAGISLLKDRLPDPGAGFWAGPGSLGLLTLARIGTTAWYQHRGAGVAVGRTLRLTFAAWALTRIATWWLIDLARGMSPMS